MTFKFFYVAEFKGGLIRPTLLKKEIIGSLVENEMRVPPIPNSFLSRWQNNHQSFFKNRSQSSSQISHSSESRILSHLN